MKYAFIGCGNMGGAIASALSRTTKDILLCDKDTDKAAALAARIGCTVGELKDAAQCDTIFLGVKPQSMNGMLSALSPLLSPNAMLVTMAAGLTMEKINAFAGGNRAVIRIMPNTPVAVGKGMVLYCTNERVSAEKEAEFVSDMAPCGILDKLAEELIDAGCSLQGCGPAYMYMFLEGLAQGAVSCGLPEEKAISYAAATMAGAAEMVLQSDISPATLRDNVCSPGGSTIEGVKVLQKSGLYEMTAAAIQAAYKRNKELGQ